MNKSISRKQFLEIIILSIISLFSRGIKYHPKPKPAVIENIVIDWRDNAGDGQEYFDHLLENLRTITYRSGQQTGQGVFRGIESYVVGVDWDRCYKPVWYYSPNGDCSNLIKLENDGEQEDF